MYFYRKAIISTFFGCLISTLIFGQMSDSVKKYYQFKNAAERSILDSNYRSAFENYQKAFAYKHPNLLDAYNAFLVAFEVRDSMQCYSLFKDLVFHGMRKDRLEKLSFFKSAAGEPFYKFIVRNYDSLVAVPVERLSIDRKYIDVLNIVYHRDANARLSKVPDSVVAADMTNIRELKNYINSNGYPSYWRVGFYEDSYEGWIHYFGTIWLLMLHTRHLSKDLNDQLYQAVNNGDLAAEDYAIFLDLQNKDKQMYHSFFAKEAQENGTMGLITPAAVSTVDKQRAMIGLDNLAVYKRKLEFQRRDPRFYFVPAYMIAFQFSQMDIAQF